MDDERRNPIDFGHGFKGQGQLWHSVYKTLWAQYGLQFLSNHFQTLHVSDGWEEEEPHLFWVTGSNVKVRFGTLCIRPCGHDTDYSFCPITFHTERWWEEEPIDFESRGQRSRSNLALCVKDLVGRVQTTVFAQSLSNFTYKLWMMRGGTLLILGQGFKCQGQIWHFVYKTLWTRYRLQL